VCDAASHGFSVVAADHLVTVAFTPPEGASNLVVIAADCAAIEDTCEATLDGGTVSCVPMFPLQGTPSVEVLQREGRSLRLRFPNSAGMVPGGQSELTLSGPAAIAVTRRDEPLPCGLAVQPCSAHGGLTACVDVLYAVDGSCDPSPNDLFAHFTALPPPNDARGVCSDPSPICTARATGLQMTADAAGNLLIPMDWSGVLIPRTAAEAARSLGIARLMEAMVAVEAFPATGRTLRIPSDAFMTSLSIEGGRLAPVFEPRVDTEAEGLTLFGSTDAPRSVLRVARRSPLFRQCHGGDQDGAPCVNTDDCPGGDCGQGLCTGGDDAGDPCVADADCSGGECGPALFDFRSRFAADVGPIVLPRFAPGFCQNTGVACTSDTACGESRCVSYRVAAAEPVPLEGLIESSDVLIAVVPEAIDGRDLNGDGDFIDDVLLLSDRRTGARLPIGTTTVGRAATRILELPFEYPAVASEGDIAAFLEPEPLQGEGDRNGDGDTVDTILRVYRAAAGRAESLLDDMNIAVDAAPAVNGRNLIIDDGLLWFRSSEAASAPPIVTRVSVSADGSGGDGGSRRPALSPDGEQVAFESEARNLPGGNPAAVSTFVRDRRRASSQRVAVQWPIVPPDASVTSPSLSGDGRWVAVVAEVTNGNRQVFMYDRDADGNGVLDEPTGIATNQMSHGTESRVDVGDGDSLFPTLVPDGRYLVFLSNSANVTGLGYPSPLHIMSRDRDPDRDGILDHSSNEVGDYSLQPVDTNSEHLDYGPDATGQRAAVSVDGRFIAFSHYNRNLPIVDVNDFCLNLGESTHSCADVLLKDQRAGSVELLSVSSNGEQGNLHSLTPAMSGDGRFIAFYSGANNLVPADTNEAMDVFLHDHRTHVTSRVSVASDGTQGHGASYDFTLAMSADGRYVAFGSTADNLVPDDRNTACDNDGDGERGENCNDIFVHDRFTGFTQRISRADSGSEGNGHSTAPAMSADGRVVAFDSMASTLVPGDNNGASDVFVTTADPARDRTGNGTARDTVLQVLDTRSTGAEPITVAPTSQVAVHGDCAAFLLPERALDPGALDSDRNGDGDRDDEVVHLYCARGSGGVVNLRRAAVGVALNDEWVAALISESAENSVDRNGDGDTYDTVLQIARRDGRYEWIEVNTPADLLLMNATVVTVLSPEDTSPDLNGDGDANDRVVQLYDLRTHMLSSLGEAAEDLVLGERLFAFRTAEAAQGGRDLNGDGDTLDAVMQVYDLVAGRLTNTGQAATTCSFPSCDPRLPYRVAGDTVTFLTREAEQSEDLTNNGDYVQLVKQVFNVRTVPAAREPSGALRAVRAESGSVTVIGAVSTGICSDSGAACAGDMDCSAPASCFVPPGECVVDLGRACSLSALGQSGTSCGANEVCVPTGEPGKGTCHLHQGVCETDASCTAPARCKPADRNLHRLVAPLSGVRSDEVFLAAGRCSEDLGTPCDGADACGSGERCAPSASNATCHRFHGTCRVDDDCAGGAVCAPELVVATAADSDGDGVADPFDDCPLVSNTDQADRDADGVGDACQAAPQAPTPTATPDSDGDHDGCTIAVGEPGGGVLLLPMIVLLYLRRRAMGTLRAAHWQLAAGGLALVLSMCGPSRARACAGDCDWSGQVDVSDLVRLVNIALERQPVTGCVAGDRDRAGDVTINELVTAVNHALAGCARVAAGGLAAATLSAARALAYITRVTPALGIAYDGADGSTLCELGGDLVGVCEDVAPGVLRATVSTTDCHDYTYESTMGYYGTATVSGSGGCTLILLPANIRVGFAMNVINETDDRVALLDTRLDAVVTLEQFLFGDRPCSIRGAVAVLDGTLVHRDPDGRDVMAQYDEMQTRADFSDFFEHPQYGCEPLTVSIQLDGPVHLRDSHGADVLETAVLAEALIARIDRSARTFTVTGRVKGECFDGTAQIDTLEPLTFLLSESCYAAGKLRIETPAGVTLVTINADTSVDIDVDEDGIHDARYDTCAALPGACEP
jgi:Tol biopolymer transport system component